jgi:hypothetical protein
MPHSAIAVFTGNSIEDILAAGGSASWVLNEKHASRQQYLVCVRNARDAKFADPEPHGAAFLVGAIKGLRHVGHDRKGLKRWTIEIARYAPLVQEDIWREWRNPVKYTTLEDLGISPAKLKDKWKPMPQPSKAARFADDSIRPLSFEEAKAGLSLKYEVPIEAIRIIIER